MKYLSQLLPRPIGNFSGIGELGNTTVTFNWDARFTDLISRIIGVLTAVGGLWFLFQLFIGALNWLSSGSDKQGLDNAKKRITNACIGLLVVVMAYTLTGLVGLMLGIDILNLEVLLESLLP